MNYPMFSKIWKRHSYNLTNHTKFFILLLKFFTVEYQNVIRVDPLLLFADTNNRKKHRKKVNQKYLPFWSFNDCFCVVLSLLWLNILLPWLKSAHFVLVAQQADLFLDSHSNSTALFYIEFRRQKLIVLFFNF